MNNKFRYTRLAVIALSAALTLGSVTPAWADGGTSGTAASIGKVSIADSSYFELKQIHVMPDQSGKLATFTVSIHNDGSTELQFIDYWVRLKSKSGNQFSAHLLPADKDKNRVSPGSTVDLTFYANVNETTNLQDLVVQFIKWDFSQPNFERVLGEVAVPDSFTDVTAPGSSTVITIGGSDVLASITKYVSNKNEKYHVPTIYLTLENVSAHAVTIPSYLYSIRTSDGLLYPLEVKGAKDLKINPKESKEIQLSGSIPVAVSNENWQLTLAETIADLKLDISVASFQLPAVSQTDGGSVGQEYPFTSEDGVYTAQLNGLYRLPWEDQDLLTADLTLSNKGDESLPIPNLTGYFLLDDAVKVEAKLVQTAKVIGLSAGGQVNLQIQGKIPYTYAFSQIKLVLQENESEDTTSASTGASGSDADDSNLTDVLEFSSQAELQAIPYFGLGESYDVGDVGRKTNFKVRSVSNYTGSTAEIFAAQVEATNLEKRYSNISKLVAHFRSQDGTVFPATVAEVTKKISPSGKALLNIWTTLPHGYSTKNMNLLLGDAVTEGKLTEGEDAKPDSYVNPVAFWLPDELDDVTETKTVLKDLNFYPYTLSINHISTQIKYTAFTLGFNYEISKDIFMETNVEGHKIVLLFEDGSGKKSFEKSFDATEIDPAEDDTPETPQSKLKLGKHEGFKIELEDKDLIYESEFLKEYKLSIFDEFQGQRKLLGTQSVHWFTTTD